MKIKIQTQLIFGIVIVFFTSCSLEQRRYTSGYYIDWNSKKVNSQENSFHDTKRPVENTGLCTTAAAQEIEIPDTIVPDNTVTANSDKVQVFAEVKKTIALPIQSLLKVDQLIKLPGRDPRYPNGDPSKDWEAVLGVFFIIVPPVGLVLSLIALKSEYRHLALLGVIISSVLMFAAILIVIKLAEVHSNNFFGGF
jgi:hypothetical protein